MSLQIATEFQSLPRRPRGGEFIEARVGVVAASLRPLAALAAASSSRLERPWASLTSPLAALAAASSSRLVDAESRQPSAAPRRPRGGEFIEARARVAASGRARRPRRPRGGEFIEAPREPIRDREPATLAALAAASSSRPGAARAHDVGSPSPPSRRRVHRGRARPARRGAGCDPSPPSRRRVHRGCSDARRSRERARPSPPSRRRVHRGSSQARARRRGSPSPPSRRRVHRGMHSRVRDTAGRRPRRPRGGEFIEASRCLWTPLFAARPSPPSRRRVHRGAVVRVAGDRCSTDPLAALAAASSSRQVREAVLCRVQRTPSPPSRRRVHRGCSFVVRHWHRASSRALAALAAASSSRLQLTACAIVVPDPSPPSRRRVHRGLPLEGGHRTGRPRRPRGGEFIEAP